MDLRSLFSRTQQEDAPDPAEPLSSVRPVPAQAHFVVGDLHGHRTLFEQMLEEIDHVIGMEAVTNPALCFVGNILDHGPDSQSTLWRMKELTDEFPNNVVCLMGNHEQMLLDYLLAPAARQARWLRDGGAATCASFGIDVNAPEFQTPEALAEALQTAIGPILLAWLAARPVRRQSGNLTIVHAGADPARDMNDQTERVMIWGHPEFLSRPRTDGHWIAHGHHPVEKAKIADGRIAVNTDVARSGKLSCAYIPVEGDVRFLQVSREP